MKSKTYYNLCIMAMRYALTRDNHLEPSGCISDIKEVLGNSFMEYEWKLNLARQLLEYELSGTELKNADNIRDIEEFRKWLADWIVTS